MPAEKSSLSLFFGALAPGVFECCWALKRRVLRVLFIRSMNATAVGIENNLKQRNHPQKQTNYILLLLSFKGAKTLLLRIKTQFGMSDLQILFSQISCVALAFMPGIKCPFLIIFWCFSARCV
jgi:hypothetical protein